MKLADLIAAFERIAPTAFAESWDNVGLLVGDREQGVNTILLTIDLTREVLAEALTLGADVVYAYHPPLFKPVKNLYAGNVVFEAIRRNVAIYSPHTALDVAPGGTNDSLADALRLEERKPLRKLAAAETELKLVVFVPEGSLADVSNALFASGAGAIGQYSNCSFRTEGEGTFFGSPATSPTVGERGRFEVVKEVKLEVLVPVAHVEGVLAALRATHPYEEPAFDLVRLHASPSSQGIGRVGTIAPRTLASCVDALKRHVGVAHALVAGSPARVISRVAIAAGSGGDLLQDAISQGAELFVTGELGHHAALAAHAAGLSVVCLLHSHSERRALEAVAARLGAALPEVSFVKSRVDRDPFAIA
jgi:dinuclear metal center YbgI/SA1388 family protein